MTHFPACDCDACRATYRQGRSIASTEASAKSFVVAAVGIVVTLVLALVTS